MNTKKKIEYRDLVVADIPEIRAMRDATVKQILDHRFKAALEVMQDLKAFLTVRRVHPTYFLNLLKEILVIAREMGDEPTLLLDFEMYFRKHWRRD